MKNTVLGYFFFSIFALAGIACGTASGYMFYHRCRLMLDGEKAEGRVIAVEHGHSGRTSTSTAPVIEFTTQTGQKVVYHSNVYTNIDPFQVGDAIVLWYDPTEPEKVVLKEGGMTIILLLLLFMCTHGGVGIGGLVWLERKRRLNRWLQEYGREIKARFTGGQRSGKSGYTARCAWVDPLTQQEYHFTSDWMRSNPETLFPPGALLRVLIDPDNPKRYWVDVA